MIVVVPLFLWPDLKRYGQNIHGHFIQRRIKKVGETSHFGMMSTTLTTCVDRALRLGHDTNQPFVFFVVGLGDLFGYCRYYSGCLRSFVLSLSIICCCHSLHSCSRCYAINAGTRVLKVTIIMGALLQSYKARLALTYLSARGRLLSSLA